MSSVLESQRFVLSFCFPDRLIYTAPGSIQLRGSGRNSALSNKKYFYNKNCNPVFHETVKYLTFALC